jgi:hypothetical protein
MKTRIRLLAGMTTLTGAALLVSPQPAYSTMSLDQLDPLGTRYCCAVDTDGDRRGDTYCCYRSGCTIDSTGCRQVAAS